MLTFCNAEALGLDKLHQRVSSVHKCPSSSTLCSNSGFQVWFHSFCH